MTETESNVPTPAIIQRIWDIILEWGYEIAKILGAIAAVLTILDVMFDVQVSVFGDVIANFVTSSSFVSSIVLLIVAFQILVYQRVEWLVDQVEQMNQESMERDSNSEESREEAVTDGGKDLPPRDSEGKFTSSGKGGSSILLLLFSAGAGYLFADSIGIEPIAGALAAAGLVILLQSNND